MDRMSEARALCAAHWNPIGTTMRGFGEGEEKPWHLPADEYDTYLAQALAMITAGRPRREVVDYLSVVESEDLGLSQPLGDKTAFVNALARLVNEAPPSA